MAPRSRVLLVTCAMLVVGLVAVVGGSIWSARSTEDDARTITWWVPNWDRPTAERLVAEFESEHPQYSVELVETTSDTLANRVTVALESGEVPDVITELGSRSRTYIENGRLADLSALFGPGGLPRDDFIDGSLEAVSGADGGLYAVPYRWDAIALLYDRDLLDEVGASPPSTWDELEETARLITDETDAYGVAWPMNGNPPDMVGRFMGFALSAGATISDGLPTLSPQSAQAALDVVGSSVAEGWASPSSLEVDNSGVRELFLNGQVGMYVGGVFDVNEILAAGVNVGTALTPGLDGPGTQMADGWVYLVPQDAGNREGAELLVTFLARPENMNALTLTYPARLSAAEDERFHDPLREAHYEQVAEHSVPAANDPRWITAIPYVYGQIQSVALGESTPEEAAGALVREVERVSAP